MKLALIILPTFLLMSNAAATSLRKTQGKTDPLDEEKMNALPEDEDVDNEEMKDAPHPFSETAKTPPQYKKLRQIENNKCIAFYGYSNWATLLSCSQGTSFSYDDYHLVVRENGPEGHCLEVDTDSFIPWVRAAPCDYSGAAREQIWYATRVLDTIDTFRWYNLEMGMYLDDMDSGSFEGDMIVSNDNRYSNAQWFGTIGPKFFE